MLISLSLDLNNIFVPAISCKLHSISVDLELSKLILYLWVDAPTYDNLLAWVRQGRGLSLHICNPEKHKRER